MPVYTTNIPQATDNPSVSQGQLLQNFQTLNNVYGTAGDHYAWDDTTPGEQSKHARVTLPGLPTTNAPGNACPQPLAGNCAIFGLTRDSQTTPFLARDGLASPTPADFVNIWPLLPIKAMATITGNGTANPTIDTQFNIDTITQTGGSLLTVTLKNAMRTSNYGILNLYGSSSNAPTIKYNITGTTTFQLTASPGGIFSQNGTKITIVVLEP